MLTQVKPLRLPISNGNFVNNEVTKELGIEKDYVITADTDSLFFELKDLITKVMNLITKNNHIANTKLKGSKRNKLN